uniref:Alpha-N-acetylgalactosaminide alpha-2,6-sialyltransferase 6 n=1 Tax=Latimeria chalumnae TaxID=7897 RepID=H3BAW0_LATCH
KSVSGCSGQLLPGHPGHFCLPNLSRIMSRSKAQGVMIFVVLFVLATLLFLYSSSNGNTIISYISLPSSRKFYFFRPPLDLRLWGVKNGYLPVYGNKTFKLHCQECALITSSSHLLGSNMGLEIDQSECTIRMNDAPTTGYEKYVGSKTTIRVVAHSSVYRVLRKPQEFLNKTSEMMLIFWGPPNKMQQEKKGTLFRLIQKASMTFPSLSTFIISPQKMRQFDDLFRDETGRDRKKSRSWLSTGWFTMVIAVELCDRIHVYGMVPPNYCSQRPLPKKMAYHYYEPKGPDECTTYLQNERGWKGNHHRFITEKKVYARWARRYNITFSNPKW